jgi:hypothetical protein
VTEQEERQARMPSLGELHHRVDVVHVFRHVVDVEALALGLAAAAKVERIHGVAVRDELLGGPAILPSVGIHAVADDDDRTGVAAGRTPGAHENARAAVVTDLLLCERNSHRRTPAVSNDYVLIHNCV